MPSVRNLKIGYAVACACWLAYVLTKLFSAPAAAHNPNPMAAVYCLLLIGVIPALAGYFLLFKVAPRIGRAVRQS